MARIRFTAVTPLRHPARLVFDALVDWRGHARWVPMTRVRVESGDGGPGTTFVATTGLGPLALPDRMRVEECDADAMTVRIVKIGPVLSGEVRIAVSEQGPDASEVTWLEDIRVPLMPQFLAGPVAYVTRRAFELSLDRLGTVLSGMGPARPVGGHGQRSG